MTDSYHFTLANLCFPSGASVLTSGDKIVGRVEAEQKAAFSTAIDRLAAQIEADLMKGLMPAPEPKRARLDWNKPTPFDTFKGWEPVISGSADYACPEQSHPLQRLSEASPTHGSAALL